MAGPFSRDLTPISSTTVTLGASATVKALVEAAGGTISARLKCLVIKPIAGVTGYIFLGTASSAKSTIGSSGESWPCSPAGAALIQLQGSGTVDVWQLVTG